MSERSRKALRGLLAGSLVYALIALVVYVARGEPSPRFLFSFLGYSLITLSVATSFGYSADSDRTDLESAVIHSKSALHRFIRYGLLTIGALCLLALVLTFLE